MLVAAFSSEIIWSEGSLQPFEAATVIFATTGNFAFTSRARCQDTGLHTLVATLDAQGNPDRSGVDRDIAHALDSNAAKYLAKSYTAAPSRRASDSRNHLRVHISEILLETAKQPLSQRCKVGMQHVSLKQKKSTSCCLVPCTGATSIMHYDAGKSSKEKAQCRHVSE